MPYPLVPEPGSSERSHATSVPKYTTSWGTQEIPEPLPTKPQTVQVHGALRLKQALGSLPQAGRQSGCTCGPQMALRDLAQKATPLTRATFLLQPHPTPLLCNLGISLHPLKSEALPYSQKTEAHRREATPGRELRRSTRTHTDLGNSCTHKGQHAHTLHRHTGPPQGQRLGRTSLRSGSLSSVP